MKRWHESHDNVTGRCRLQEDKIPAAKKNSHFKKEDDNLDDKDDNDKGRGATQCVLTSASLVYLNTS